LVHQPVIVAIAFVVVRWQVGVPIKLIVLASTSLVGTLIAAELLGRTELTRRAFGLGETGDGRRGTENG
jgi:peptidoglycan/LPS O-acetylase OafA/YrhL